MASTRFVGREEFIPSINRWGKYSGRCYGPYHGPVEDYNPESPEFDVPQRTPGWNVREGLCKSCSAIPGGAFPICLDHRIFHDQPRATSIPCPPNHRKVRIDGHRFWLRTADIYTGDMGTPSLDQVPNLTRISREEAEGHKRGVADLLHRNNLNFPGAQPVSFARKHLRELEQRDYFLAEKTDGIRLLLYLTQIPGPDGGSIEAQFFIDRKNEYYYLAPGWLHIPTPNPDVVRNPKVQPQYLLQSWHIGTLIDGELVHQQFKDGRKQLTFLMFDCLAIDGNSIVNHDFSYRLGKIHSGIYKAYRDFVKDWPEEGRAQPFQLDVKKPEVSYAAPQMFDRTIPHLPHGNDGLIFTCKDTSYQFGTDDHILKWKPPHENTIDFRIQLGAFPLAKDDEGEYEDFDQKPEIELLIWYGGDKGYQPFVDQGTKQYLHLTDTEWESMKRMGQQIDWRILECFREKDTGHWRPKVEPDGTPRYRDDKDHANHESTVVKVLESIADAVSQEDLIKHYEPIRKAWKERERRHQEEKKQRQQQEQAEQRRQHEQQMEQRRQQEAAKKAEAEKDDGPGYED